MDVMGVALVGQLEDGAEGKRLGKLEGKGGGG